MKRGAPLARENGRELEALVLACVWVLGVEAFPLHHQLAHASLAPHVHREAGEVAHSHGDGVWHVHAVGSAHAVPADVSRRSAALGDPQGSSRTSSLDASPHSHARHGAGSLAHKHLLFPAPASPMPEVAQALFAYVLPRASSPRLESVAASSPARARGPPRAAYGLRCAAT